MDCEVRYFGMIAEKLGIESEKINEAELTSSMSLKALFKKRYPVLNGMTFQCAVDGELRDDLPNNKITTIAVLPPFAGG